MFVHSFYRQQQSAIQLCEYAIDTHYPFFVQLMKDKQWKDKTVKEISKQQSV